MKKIMFYGLMSRWAIFALVLLTSACGLTPQETARTSIGVVATGVRAIDVASAQAYTERARAALAASADLAAYRAAMAPMDDLESALRVADEALLAAEAVVDSWSAEAQQRWLGVAACVAEALNRIRLAVAATGVTVPSELEQALDMAQHFTGTCTPVVTSSGGVS